MESAYAAESQELLYAALALLPALMVEVSLTLFHLSVSQKRAAHSAFFLLSALTTAAGWSVSYDSRSGGAILLAWLAICMLATIVLWVPVMKSPVRKQKHDETTRNAVIWLIAPMIPLQAFMMLRVFEREDGGVFTFIYFLLAGISLAGFLLFRFVLPALRAHKLSRTSL